MLAPGHKISFLGDHRVCVGVWGEGVQVNWEITVWGEAGELEDRSGGGDR